MSYFQSRKPCLCALACVTVVSLILLTLEMGILLKINLPEFRIGSPSVISLHFTRSKLIAATYDIILFGSNPNRLCSVSYYDVSVALFYTDNNHTHGVGYVLLASTPINSFSLTAGSHGEFGNHVVVAVYNKNSTAAVSPNGLVSFVIELSAMISFHGHYRKILCPSDQPLKVVCNPIPVAFSPDDTAGQVLVPGDLTSLCP